MKKLIMLIILLNAVAIYSQDKDSKFPDNSVIFSNLHINLQANTLQSFSTGDSVGRQEYFKNNNAAIGIEWVFNYESNLNLGFGIIYQFPASIKALNGKIGYAPVYASLDLPINHSEVFPAYLSVRIGFSILMTDGKIERSSHGLYHAIGFSADIEDNCQLKLLYSNNYGTIKINKHESDFNNGNLSFVLSIKL